jgi:hypothetical protein
MSIIKLIGAVSLTVAIITMITSNQLSIYASPTTEDDGYTFPDDASEEEKEEIDEREQEAWEDAGRPGERDDDDDDENDNDGNDNDNTPVIANAPTLTVQNTAVNETRWYNNCVGSGKQDGGGLQFNTFSYQTCGQNADGDKGYYDGFVQGCMGIDSANTQELCQSYVVECLRATSVDSSETCDADVDTTSNPWKLVMARPN